MDVRVGLWRRLSAEELMLLKCGVGEDSWESLELQGDPASPFWRTSALGFPWKEWCWSWNSSTLATSCEELTHWKKLWCGEGFGVGGEGEDRGWEGWMASLTQRTWVWVNSGSWWWTGRPGVLRFMGSQRIGYNWATELNWKSLQMVTAAKKLKDTYSLEGKLWPTWIAYWKAEPKDSSIHLCLFCSLAYRVIIAIFLNSIYMCLCTVLACFFLTSFTQYNRLPFHPPLSNWFKRILCNGWGTFHCVYVHQLSYPLVSWWTSRLLPCPGYY